MQRLLDAHADKFLLGDYSLRPGLTAVLPVPVLQHHGGCARLRGCGTALPQGLDLLVAIDRWTAASAPNSQFRSMLTEASGPVPCGFEARTLYS